MVFLQPLFFFIGFERKEQKGGDKQQKVREVEGEDDPAEAREELAAVERVANVVI